VLVYLFMLSDISKDIGFYICTYIHIHAIYSRRSFIQESKHLRKHPNNRIVLKDFFNDHPHSLVNLHDIFKINKGLYRCMCFLNLFTSYHTLCPILHTLSYVLKRLSPIILLFCS
jgi:hypothetical protein